MKKTEWEREKTFAHKYFTPQWKKQLDDHKKKIMCLGHTPGVYFPRLIDSHMAIRINSTVIAKLTFSTIVFDPLQSTRNRSQCSFSYSG